MYRQHAIHAFSGELEPHFKIEESTLLPLLQGVEENLLAQRTLLDHQKLRGLVKVLNQNNIEALHEFGKCLSAHIRFEERELFPVIENLLN